MGFGLHELSGSLVAAKRITASENNKDDILNEGRFLMQFRQVSCYRLIIYFLILTAIYLSIVLARRGPVLKRSRSHDGRSLINSNIAFRGGGQTGRYERQT